MDLEGGEKDDEDDDRETWKKDVSEDEYRDGLIRVHGGKMMPNGVVEVPDFDLAGVAERMERVSLMVEEDQIVMNDASTVAVVTIQTFQFCFFWGREELTG